MRSEWIGTLHPQNSYMPWKAVLFWFKIVSIPYSTPPQFFVLL